MTADTESLQPCPFCKKADGLEIVWLTDEGEIVDEEEVFSDVYGLSVSPDEDDTSEDERKRSNALAEFQMTDYCYSIGISCKCGCSLVQNIDSTTRNDNETISRIIKVWNHNRPNGV